MKDNRTVFAMPSLLKGNGLGHLFRCGRLAEKMENCFLYLPEADKEGFFSRKEVEKALGGRVDFEGRSLLEKAVFTKEDYIELYRSWNNDSGETGSVSGPAVILDRRETLPSTFHLLPGNPVLIGIDEGGSYRDCFTYLADTLPAPLNTSRANISSPFLLEGPVRRRENPEEIRNVLVTFGGEDPGNLSIPVLDILELLNESRSGGDKLKLTLCLGPLALHKEPEVKKHHPGIELLTAPENLKELLADYDLVFTSFGLTAFEAFRAGVPVILVNPSAYHQELSLKSGFKTLPFPVLLPGNDLEKGRASTAENISLLTEAPGGINRDIGFQTAGSDTDLPGCPVPELADFLSEAVFDNPVCPACGTPLFSGIPDNGFSGAFSEGVEPSLELLDRFAERTYYKCRCCSIVFQNLHKAPEEDYDEDYFFEGYRKQYGKTYLEDFPNLRKMAKSRLDIISGLSGGGRKILLEAGCAYGPFMVEASEAGYRALGIDVSSGGVDYVINRLKLEAAAVSLEEFEPERDFGIEKADVVALWYVIEHFPDLKKVLEKIGGLQKSGGILAFSTPNCRGISGRKNLRGFLEQSPMDHYQVWSPSIARKVLKLYGYRVRKIRVTGHHPERFPGEPVSGGVIYGILMIVSRIFGLGDTFEVYAEKG